MFSELSKSIRSIFNETDEDVSNLDKSDALSDLSEKEDFSKSEKNMLEGVIKLKNTKAKEILVPTPDIESIPANLKVNEIPEYVSGMSYTRYPVITEDKNHIIGYIDIKDILLTDTKNTTNIDASKISRDIPIIPETTNLYDVLRTLRDNSKQMAVVINEWGSLEGIITIEDIIETIVGDIVDEYDNPENEPHIKRTDVGYISDGNVSIKEINNVLGAEFEKKDGVDTIAGFILSHIGHLPDENDEFKINNYNFKIQKVSDKRILKIGIVHTNEKN